MFDAYTIKKVVPRLVIGVIGVNLSWYICKIILDYSNILGAGISTIMLEPFATLTSDVAAPLNAGDAGIIAGLGLTAVVLFTSWAVIVPVIVAGLVALFVGYVVLIIRQMILVLLILIAPLAIALWVLPGTEQWAKKWFSLYVKLCLMYPIVIALLTSGRVLAKISLLTTRSGDDANVIAKAVAIIALFAPYFMIPFAFKFVGGAMATIAGVVNNQSKGLVDRTRNWSNEYTQNRPRHYNRAASKEAKASVRKGAAQRRALVKLGGQLDDEKGSAYQRWRARQLQRDLGSVGWGDRVAQRVKDDGRVDKITGDIKARAAVQADQLDMEATINSIKVNTAGMDSSQAKRAVQAMFEKAVDSGDGIMMRAAMKQMTDLKGVKEIEDMNNYVAQHAANTGTTEVLTQWNSAVSENYGDLKSMSPHLAVSFDETTLATVSGPGTAAAKSASLQAHLEDERRKSFVGANLETLAGMKKEGWERFEDLAPVERATKQAGVESNDTLKGKLNLP